jgi:hypothetical protein
MVTGFRTDGEMNMQSGEAKGERKEWHVYCVTETEVMSKKGRPATVNFQPKKFFCALQPIHITVQFLIMLPQPCWGSGNQLVTGLGPAEPWCDEQFWLKNLRGLQWSYSKMLNCNNEQVRPYHMVYCVLKFHLPLSLLPFSMTYMSLIFWSWVTIFCFVFIHHAQS